MANLSTKSKFNVINYFKEEGNTHFKKKEYHQSLQFYQHCLSFLDSIHFDEIAHNKYNDDEKEKQTHLRTTTSLILSNLSETHLRINATNPDLYSHLLSALNCAQISLQLNPANIKSNVRRIITLHRLGLFEFAQQIIDKVIKKHALTSVANMASINKEKKKIENQSVKYHIDRFKHELLTNDGTITDKEQDIDIEKNIFLRIAAAELIRQNKYDFDDFICKHFGAKLQSLQVITMIGVFLNWDSVKIALYFIKYLKIYLEDNALSFDQMKKVIVETVKIENTLWPTDQCWKLMVKQIIVDRHEIEWCEILNCSDDGVLNQVYDKYKQQITKISEIKFNDGVKGSDNYKWLQTEINALKRMHDIDKGHIIKLAKVLKELQKKYDILDEKMVIFEAKDNGYKEIDALKKQMFYVQVGFAVFVALIAILIVYVL